MTNCLPDTVLVVEDSPSDQRLIKELLVELGIARAAITCVGTLGLARQALSDQPQGCVLLDLSLPDAVGLEGVAVMAAAAPDVPIVIISGGPADSMAYAAMAEGADEYLCKSDLDPLHLHDTLMRAAQRRLGSDRSQRVRANASSVLDSIEAATATLDGSGRIVAVNQAWTMFAASGGAGPTTTGVGLNYLTVCDQAVGVFAEEAKQAAAGIRSVLRGEAERFAMDYPCPSPGPGHGVAPDGGQPGDGMRWFSLRVTPVGLLGGGAVVTHLDITDLKLGEQQLRLGEARLHRLLDESSPIFALVGRDGVVQHVSEATTNLLGLHVDEEIGRTAFDRIEDADRANALAVFARVVETPGRKEQVTLRVRDRSGRRRELDLSVVNLLDDPKVGALAVTGADVTQSRFTQIARQLESRLLQRLPASVIVADDRGVIVYWNDRAAEMYGHSSAEAVGRHLAEIGIGPIGVDAVDALVDLVMTKGVWEGDYNARRSDGAVLPVRATIERIDDDDIDFHGIVGASIDITQRRRLEEDLAFQALHDPLTELPNRRLFIDHLDNALARSRRSGRRIAVLFIDLDDFKAVNDRVGHAAGDKVLRQVGELVSGVLRVGDIVARLGGDEFVVCCDELDDPAEAYAVAERVLGALAAPTRRTADTTVVTASIGVAISGPDSQAEGMLRNADIAMYSAKEQGKARLELFDDALHDQVMRRRELATELAQALDLGQITAFFQPELALRTGELVGFEALARWIHPERGMVGPDEFIPIAEESGLIGRLGRDVMSRACRALAGWLETTPGRRLTVSVNVSAHQLSDPGFPAVVRDVLAETGIPPDLLCLEVTESALAAPDVAIPTLEALKTLGVEIAIDDFGTGYSSLNRLRRFPLDYLKIDRSFVAGMSEKHEDAVIVEAVLGLAGALALRTIAEGVESTTQLEQLVAAGCDIGQGYLWSPPVPAEDAALMAASGSVSLGGC